MLRLTLRSRASLAGLLAASLLAPAFLAVALQATSGDAQAQSSGGYRAPSRGYSAAPARRPSSGGSGGYALPASPGGFSGQTGSAGDTAFSRRGSAEALRQYREAQQPRPVAPPPPPRRAPNYDTYASPNPGYVPGARRPRGSFLGGFGDALVAGAIVGALTQPSGPGTAAPQPDSGPRYAQGAPGQDAAPAGSAGSTKPPPLPDQGEPARTAASDGGNGTVWVVLFLLVAAFAVLMVMRRRRGNTRPGSGLPARPPAGSAAAGFRVGMTFPIDPAPFALAAGRTKVQPPPAGGLGSVEAVGRLADASLALTRLYLPGRRAYFQIYAGPDGAIQECRYFTQIDEVSPASPQEWDLWLGGQQGMIGWPAFQTKDGKLYDRVWSPGSQRVPPRAFTETVEGVAGTAPRRHQMMLYAAETGLAAPAPQLEYILASAIEADAAAWVEIAAGIDVNPASLSLPSVKLS